MQVDIIIVSRGEGELKKFTEKAISSCHASDDIDFNILIIEQIKGLDYCGATTINYDFPFNYNKCLNLGISLTSSKYVCLCNNDLYFRDFWASNCITAMEQTGCKTSSPFSTISIHAHKNRVCDKAIISHKVGHEFLGWCIMCDRSIFDNIKIDESVEFWYSDNIFAEQLKKAGYQHCLVCNAIVDHVNMCSNTLNKMKQNEIEYYTKQQFFKYEQAKKKL
jgi:GT2 family glycosyltransferase